MGIINQITDKEMQMFDYYRSNYAGGKDRYFVSGETLLKQAWEPNKSRYLYTLLGNQLIYKERITYELPEDKIIENISNLFYSGSDKYKTRLFLREFENWRLNNREYLDKTDCFWDIAYLISPVILAQNVYTGETFYVNGPDDQIVKVQNGCKPVKTLLKVLNMWDGIKYQEEFRTEISVILTQKKLTGELCLSIHPLDYATMSDNNHNWSSCMSWQENGCYCGGTTEMMTSEAVLVGYLSSGEMNIGWGTGNTWNSKMWRELFVVSPKMICGVKGYPYQSPGLVEAALKVIAKLAKQNLGWEYDDKVIAFEHGNWFDYAHKDGEETHRYKLSFKTNTMYNDFGTITHYCSIASNWDGNVDEKGEPKSFVFNYSGPRQCMNCGELNADFDDPANLCCCGCSDSVYCQCCEGYYHEDEMYELDGEYYCESCYNDHVAYDDFSGDEHYDGNMIPVYIIPREFTEAEQQKLRENGMGAWANRYHFPTVMLHNDTIDYRWDRYMTDQPIQYRTRYWDTYTVIPVDYLKPTVWDHCEQLGDWNADEIKEMELRFL